MSKNFAIVENGKVINVIVADDDFAQMYSDSPDHIGECFEYDETNEDDTRVARIGELHINGIFVSETQAMDMGLIPDTRTVDVPESITMGQFRAMLIITGMDTVVQAVIDSIPDELQRKLAQSDFEYRGSVERHHPLVEQFIASGRMTEAEADQFFVEGAKR
ncbi:MAG: hypothetical protein JZU49_02770 [Sulfuricurvum sp.]|nr:hypothetical protein [Sulfuricurvum sp.]